MAKLRVYEEMGSEGGCILYTFDPPGLLSYGDTLEEAMAAAPREAARLRDFLAEYGRLDLLEEPWKDGETPEIVTAETVRRRGKSTRGNTRGTFKRDLEPVRPEEVPGFLAILGHQRQALWTLKDRLPEGAYGFKSLPRRMTIKEQLTHIAACDRWYLSRYWRDLPTLRRSKDVWDKLTLNRDLAIERLGHLSPDDRAAARTTDGQVWTARKLFRRFMYHERFHLDTIERDLALYLKGAS